MILCAVGSEMRTTPMTNNKNQMGSKVSSALEVGLLMALMCARASENVTFFRYDNSKVITKSVDKSGETSHSGSEN